MKVSPAKLSLADNKQTFSCPICNAAWMTNIDGEYAHRTCKHLRFVWYFDGSIQYKGTWDTDTFEKEIRKRYIKMSDLEDQEGIEHMHIKNLFPLDPEEFFSSFKCPDIDEVLWYVELERIAVFRVI